MDIRTVEGRFTALTDLLIGERAGAVRRMGDTPASRRRLCAGLLLRAVLGPSERIFHSPTGKPYIEDGPLFNLSHAGDYAVLATASDAVGIDVEQVRDRSYERLVARFFHPDESAYIAAQSDRTGAFFTIWTLKESYLKAEGTGFSIPTASFCILPAFERGATMRPDAGYHFRRYPFSADYRLSVCAAEDGFCDTIHFLSADDQLPQC